MRGRASAEFRSVYFLRVDVSGQPCNARIYIFAGREWYMLSFINNRWKTIKLGSCLIFCVSDIYSICLTAMICVFIL